MDWHDLPGFDPFDDNVNPATKMYFQLVDDEGLILRIATSGVVKETPEGRRAFFQAYAMGGLTTVMGVLALQTMGPLRQYRYKAMPEPKKMFRENDYKLAISALRTRFLQQLPEELRDTHAEAMGPRQPSDAPGAGSTSNVSQPPPDADTQVPTTDGGQAPSTAPSTEQGDPAASQSRSGPTSFDTSGLMAPPAGEPVKATSPLDFPDTPPPGTQTHLHGS